MDTTLAESTATNKSLPLTDMQQAYYIGGGAEHGGAAFFYFEIDLDGFEPRRFEVVWETIWKRHDVLKYRVQDGGLQERIECPFPGVTVEDLRRAGQSGQQERLLETMRGLTQRFPDVEHDCPFEVKISLLTNGMARLHVRLSLLATDGHGVGVLLRELATLYHEGSQALKPAPDYARLLRQLAPKAAERNAAKAWWAERLDRLPPPPALPRNMDAPSDVPLRRRTLELDAAAWRRLQRLAVSSGLTPTTAVCAVFSQVVALFSGKSAYRLGVMVSKRPSSGEFRDAIGNFTTICPLAIDVADKRPFAEVGKALQAWLFDAVEHSAYSGIEVLSALNAREGEAFRTGVPVVFSSNLHITNSVQAAEDWGPFSLYGPQWGYTTLQTPQVLLDVSISQKSNQALLVHWDAREGVFPADFSRTMAEHFVRMLSVVANEDNLAGPIAFSLPPAQLERRDLVNRTEVSGVGTFIQEPFFSRQGVGLLAPAVMDGLGCTSHGELRAVASAVAARVLRIGVKRNQLVAVVMEKGAEQIAAVLGILEAGAAYLPVDPSWPDKRRTLVLRQAEVELVITTTELAATLDWPIGVRCEAVPPVPASSAQLENPEAGRDRDVRDLAYVIFTSGSTGTPKGVMMAHDAVSNTISDINRRFWIDHTDRVFGISALHFDLSVWDIFGVLGAGGALVLPSPERRMDPEHWTDLLVRSAVTVWNSAPAVMQMLVEYLESTRQRLPANVRLVMLSGDWIPTTLPDRIRALASQRVEIVSLGGATEAAIWSVCYPIGKVDPAWPSIPYGKPLSNQTLHVLTSSLEPTADWVVGELYIGGVGLAQGYWKDSEKTGASFIIHPETGRRLYRTGDLGRFLPDGNIEFLGRRDSQIKLRGYRIELGEVEANLARLPDIAAAAVGTRKLGDGVCLAAYCVLNGKCEGDETRERIRDHLAENVPQYMVPEIILFLDALPLTANGKVDRRALQSLDAQEPDAPAIAPVRPATPVERRVAALMADVLGRPSLDADTDFFLAGGNSFAGVRLMARLREAFSIDLSISVLMKEPTARRLAARISNQEVLPARMVRLNSGARAMPVVLVHAAGGNVLSYRPLHQALDPSIPLYAIEARGLADGEVPHTRIEDMAEDYAEMVLRAVGRQPILLGGWSSGGVVAFEMVERLRARGVAVERLLLLDSPAPIQRDPISDKQVVHWFATDINNGEAPTDSHLAGTTAAQRLTAAIDSRLGELIEAAGHSLARRRFELAYEVFRATVVALRNYTPQRTDVPAVVFKATGEPIEEFASHPAVKNQDWGWTALLGPRPETFEVPGTHHQILGGGALQAISAWVTGYVGSGAPARS